MITNEMWLRAKARFAEYTHYDEWGLYGESNGETKCYIVTRKQVEEHFKANDTPRHEVSVKKNECPECFGTIVVMSDGSEYCCDCDYSYHTNPCHSGDTKPNITDLIMSEAVAFADWCEAYYITVTLGIWKSDKRTEDIRYTTSELYEIYLASKNKK